MSSDAIVIHGEWLIVAGVLLIMAIFMLYQHYGNLKRRRAFSERNLCDDSEWFDEYLPSIDDRHLIERILIGIADDIGVNWTQLRPDDTFEVLKIRKCYCPTDDLESAETVLVAIAAERGVRPEQLPAFQGSLREFIRRTSGILATPVTTA